MASQRAKEAPWVHEQGLGSMLSKLGARETPYLARGRHFEKCTFFMLQREGLLGLHEWREWAWSSQNDAQAQALPCPKILA